MKGLLGAQHNGSNKPITRHMSVKFQNPEGKERILRPSLGRKEVPYARSETKMAFNISRAKTKAGKQRKNVFKIQ